MKAVFNSAHRSNDATSSIGKRGPYAAIEKTTPEPLSRTGNPVGNTSCPCGGHCPDCADQFLPLNAPGDPFEHEADRVAERALRSPASVPEISAAASRVRFHTDGAAARSAAGLHARAFTVGSDVMFGAGQFRPDTRGGQRLIAHELAHVAQQARTGRLMVQRDASDVVEMPPLVVRSTLRPTESSVPGLGNLRGQGVDPAAPVVSRDEATIARNSPDPARRLPFISGGTWNGQDILSALGQYDTLPGTDSDAIRCVQAVAMASRIVDGPAAVTGFLRAMILQGMLGHAPTARQRTAIDVLEHVIGRIETERATFGDLMWAQEGLHDLFYNDVGGTPEPEILSQMAPALDLGRTLQRMDVWCDTPEQVMAQANLLQAGEHLIVNTWQVILNTTFDDLEEQGIEVAEGESTRVRINGRLVRIRRIRTDVRPDHTAIDSLRDHRGGHQLIIMKDATAATLRLYEPEVTDTGRHLETLAADGSNFVRYFHDQPAFGIYNYIEILGKLTPSALSTLTGSSFSAP